MNTPKALPPTADSTSAERFVSDYADEHLYDPDAPKGMCNACEHYRRKTHYSEEDTGDWCWLKEGAFAENRESECPAWISSQTTEVRGGSQ